MSIDAGNVNTTVIPLDLTQREQWCRWKLVDGQKIPIAFDGTVFKSNDSTTWAGFEQVERFDKIAFVISGDDPFTGVDLDGCLEDGEFKPWAKEILEKFAGISYCEISPSGKGVKLLCRAAKPEGSRCKKKFSKTAKEQLECYNFNRFWTVTGNMLVGFETIGDGQNAVNWLAEKYLLPDSVSPKPPATQPTKKTASDGGSTSLKELAERYVDNSEPATTGERNDKAFRLAGHLHAFTGDNGERLNDVEVYFLLVRWNRRNDDPLPDAELMRCAQNGRTKGTPPPDKLPSKKKRRKKPAINIDSPSEVLLYSLDHISGRTDIANSRRFVAQFAGELLYVPQWGKWLSWTGQRWLDDHGTGATQRAKKYADSLWFSLAKLAPTLSEGEVAEVTSFIRATSQTAKISAFMRLAQCDDKFVVQVEDLNSDPLLLNVINGTIDLRSGELLPHKPADLITQLAKVSFDADATCPKWLETQQLIFDGDDELIDYVQGILGYSISGDVGEAILPIGYGSGNNGKSTIWNAIVELLGDYAMLANESLLLGDGQGHPTDKAMLYQLRFVPISEPESGSQLRESRVKELTGDATITARRMREDFWDFKRTHTFWLSTNHLPKVSGTDQGIWRRIKLIPFTVDIAKRVQQVIPDFSNWLVMNEGSGILNWLLAGWQRYQSERGFREPKAVTSATASYKTDSDALGEWLDEHCIQEAGAFATASDLFKRYQATGGQWSKTAFGSAMAEKFRKEKPTSGNYRKLIIYHGVRLRGTSQETQQKQGLPLVATSSQVNFKNPYTHTDSTGQLGATRGNANGVVCKCGESMAPAVERIGKFRNWDCPRCGEVLPVKEE